MKRLKYRCGCLQLCMELGPGLPLPTRCSAPWNLPSSAQGDCTSSRQAAGPTCKGHQCNQAAPTSTMRWSARWPLVSALRLPATCMRQDRAGVGGSTEERNSTTLHTWSHHLDRQHALDFSAVESLQKNTTAQPFTPGHIP